MMMVPVFGALNANILAGPRVVFAASRDVQALKFFRRIDPRFGTPAVAIAVVSTWSVILILLGDLSPDPEKPLYEILVDYVIFGGSVFYLMAVVAVFVFRRRLPDAARPYRTWGYPIVPGLFVAFYLFLLATMAWSNPLESAVALAVMASGAGVYYLLTMLKRV
jgi:APA family basic amino acid/polyamine antiporter